MIDIDDGDIVLVRSTSAGRFLLFTSTDVQSGWPLPWWGVVLDTGGDGVGILVRLDETAAPHGWTARQLIAVALASANASAGHIPDPSAADVAWHVAAAAISAGNPLGDELTDLVTFVPGPDPAARGWLVARCGDTSLPLVAGWAGSDEGITPEQLLILVDQLLCDAAKIRPREIWIWPTRRHIRAALAAEMRRADRTL